MLLQMVLLLVVVCGNVFIFRFCAFSAQIEAKATNYDK